MPLLVTSASGANGNGFGALLAFDPDGSLRGPFLHDDRIADPRGLAVDPKENLLFLNSGTDRVLAISSQGRVVRDTGRIEGFNPGGGTFGPDGRYYVGSRGTRTMIAFASSLDGAGEHVLPPGVVPFPRGFAFGQDGRLFLASGIGPNGQGDNTIIAFSRGASPPPSSTAPRPWTISAGRTARWSGRFCCANRLGKPLNTESGASRARFQCLRSWVGSWVEVPANGCGGWI